MDPTDLIWMNGEFIPWEDAKVHVLTHGLHYGTGVFEGVRCYDTELGPAVFRNADHVQRLLKSAELYYMPVPYSEEELRAATREVVARNGLRSCYIRPIVYRGYGTMGLNPLEAPVDVTIACWEWGAYLGEEGKQQRRAREGVLVGADQPALADPARQGLRPVPEQRAREDRGDEVRLRRGDPARRTRTRVRGHGRERVRRARRRDRTPGQHNSILDGITRRSIIQIAQDLGYTVVERNVARAEMYLADEVFMSGTAAELVPVREVDDHEVGTGEPGEITRVLQAAFDDAIHGRSERYREWLDVVDAPALQTPAGAGATQAQQATAPSGSPATG